MAGARSLFIIIFLTILYGCGVEDQKPADATPSVAGTPPPVAFEHSMLNGTWTSTCELVQIDGLPDYYGEVTLVFQDGQFVGSEELFLDDKCTVMPVPEIRGDLEGSYSVGEELTTSNGFKAFPIDFSGLLVIGASPVDSLDIIRIEDSLFNLGVNVSDPDVRSDTINFAYTFSRI